MMDLPQLETTQKEGSDIAIGATVGDQRLYFPLDGTGGLRALRSRMRRLATAAILSLLQKEGMK